MISLLTLPSISPVNAGDAKRVLFISSYSSAFNTFYHQIDGINDTFEGQSIIVDMEFMDSKRFLTEENLTNFYNLLEYKIVEGDPYDAILVSDDNATTFVMDHKEVLFPDIPIVFFGVNTRANAIQYASDPMVTGVIEKVSMEETIQLALDLNEHADTIIALSDATPSGQADLFTFYEYEDTFSDYTMTHLSLADMTLAEFHSNIAEINEQAVIILLAALRDGDGNSYDFNTSIEMILQQTNQPIYHLYEHGIGSGLLGGKIVSHYVQAEIAANIILEVVNGTDIATISIIDQSPNVYMIDQQVFNEHGFDEDRLPPETILINANVSFFEEHRGIIIPAIILIIGQSLVIGLLLWSVKEASKAKHEALDRQDELKHLSYHDSLTNLYNRHYFEEAFYTSSNLPKVSLILADVNGLKLINDAFGHLLGDQALLKTADLLRHNFSEADICRIGGDEFAIINYDLTKVELLERMRQVRTQSEVLTVEGISISLSLGLAVNSRMDKTMNEMFTEAEDWMYREKLNQVPSNRRSIIETIIETINQKDPYSQIHSKRVSLISVRIAELMNLDDNRLNNIRTAGLLHDIGKIIVPIDILNKNGKLTKEEYEEIKKHSEIGYRILYSVASMRDIAEYVLSHHEKMDGTGYPRGLVEEDIPLESKIIAVADALDTMLNDRIYRKKFSKDRVKNELIQYQGTQFSVPVVDAVLSNFDEICMIAQQDVQ